MDIRGRGKKKDGRTPLANPRPQSLCLPVPGCPVLRKKGKVVMPSAMPVPENSNGPATVMVTASTKDRRGQASRRCR